MNFAQFQSWRERVLQRNVAGMLDCGETNLYRALASLQPKPDTQETKRCVHRCDLARIWLARYGFSETLSQRALVCRGVRHALSLIFSAIAEEGGLLWLPNDVYPVYLDLARDTGIEWQTFNTLPHPEFPDAPSTVRPEYLLITNPWKPLGRYVSDSECQALVKWLAESPSRQLIIDSVYDLRVPFDSTTRKLAATGQTVLLHSVTKGWLWPKTFGVALLGKSQPKWEAAFRSDPPSREQLSLAEKLLSREANLPNTITDALEFRKRTLISRVPLAIRKAMLINDNTQSPGCYFFPVNLSTEELLEQHETLGIPGSVFGGNWAGSVLTSLSSGFNGEMSGGAP